MVTGQRTGSCLAAWMLLLMLSAAGRMTTAQTARASKSPVRSASCLPAGRSEPRSY
jgi:hypothetical protein